MLPGTGPEVLYDRSLPEVVAGNTVEQTQASVLEKAVSSRRKRSTVAALAITIITFVIAIAIVLGVSFRWWS